MARTHKAEAIAVARRFHDEVINDLDFDLARELLHPQVRHERGAIGFTLSMIRPAEVKALKELSGAERFIEATRLLRDTFPVWRSRLVDVVASGGKVVTRCVVSGVYRGPFLNSGPQYEVRFELPQMVLETVENGRITSIFALSDQLDFWRDLGAGLPQPEPGQP